MEKDSGQYCYEPYAQPRDPPPAAAAASDSSCRCFRKRSKSRAFLTGLATNLGICALLFAYTLVGSVVFLAIEGGGAGVQHQILATTYHKKTTGAGAVNATHHHQEVKTRNERARERAVENIWDITVNLNILYRDNWTRLAAQEITRFQDELLKTLGEDGERRQVVQERRSLVGKVAGHDQFEWTFAKAFLYSLTVLTTIGYGSIAPRTTLGKAVTMGYAVVGIPLTLLYLSSVGSILSRVARGVFSRALCCCLCSNCGYCCYDEKRMAEKERRMKRKRQQMELQQQLVLQDQPFYVHANCNNSVHSPAKDQDSLTGTDESKGSMHGWSILAPIVLCLAIMFVYILLGTFALYKLENWSLLDGFYFCFMSLTTIGFGDVVPVSEPKGSDATVWFCSVYIMSGMALTAMCFNVVHDEIVHRLKHQEKLRKETRASASDPYSLTS